jgi:hypothetical protein
MMSVYQPFPLRVDSFGQQGKQYDACFQIGEFPGKNVQGTGIVILVPLKIDPNPGIGGTFVNAFANKIPNILGAQPDPLLGYPDVPAQTGANWDVSKVVDVTRPYYTWVQEDGTRVIVMAEPILIAQVDMTNIQRLPVTPPEDVIHEIGSPILYRPAPPRDANGKPVPCPQTAWERSVASIVQPPVVMNTPSVNSNLLLEVLLGIIGTLAVIIGVWFGIKLASGPVGSALQRVGNSIGSTLAGGYGTVKKATSNTLGIGWKSNPNVRFPPKRTPSPPPSPKPKPKNPGLVIRTPKSKPEPKPTDQFDFTSPGTPETLDEYRARMRRMDQQGKQNPGRARTGGPAGTGLGGKRKKRRKTGRKV